MCPAHPLSRLKERVFQSEFPSGTIEVNDVEMGVFRAGRHELLVDIAAQRELTVFDLKPGW